MFQMIPNINGSLHVKEGERSLPKCISSDHFESYAVKAYCERTGAFIGDEDAVVLKKNDTLRDEEYVLEINENGITVEGSTEHGVINGLTSLYVLSLNNGKVPYCRFNDAPVYSHRGVHLDCARHFFNAEEVKRVIEGMSLAKLNVLHWHLSDDQGFRIESKKYPKLQEKSEKYFTQLEILDVVQYAKERGIMVIPEIDMPGHTSAILAAYPELGCKEETVELAKSGGIYPTILCAGKEEVYDFLENLLDEVVPLFSSPYFHIGGDEAPKNYWKESGECKALMETEGLADYDDLQGYFTKRVSKMLEKHGKKVILWDDCLKSEIRPENCTIQYWNVDRKVQVDAFEGPFIYSDMFELYIDYPASMSSMKKIYQTKPMVNGTDYSGNEKLMGLECCLWTEHVSENELLEKRLFPRIFALAENCWSKEKNYSSFTDRVTILMEELKRKGISCLTLAESDPKGKARRQETMAYFRAMNEGMDPEIRAKTVESAKPSKEFGQRFMKEFFSVTDLPFLLKYLK